MRSLISRRLRRDARVTRNRSSPDARVTREELCLTVSRPDVVVTGLGATTPLGGDVASTWEAMVAGRSGVGALTAEWAAQLPVRIAAQLKVEPTQVLERVKLRRLDRAEASALIAAHQAWADAGLAGGDGVDPERLAVVVGTGIGGAITLLQQDDILEASGPRKVSPHTVPMLMPNGPAAWVGLELGARAGVHCPASACATGAEAIAWALDILRAGRADVVVAGGTEAVIHALPIAGFAAMRAMSTRNDEPERASRPFDKARDGFVLGEGSGVIVLETAEHARARGARVYARLAGAAMTSDGYDILHVNAHATATPVGDIAEIAALRRAEVDHAVITSTKSMTGHLLGAAGAVESIATILAVHHGVVPPTINLDDPDDALDLDVAALKARHLEIPAALNASFGFGGHNAVLVFTKP